MYGAGTPCTSVKPVKEDARLIPSVYQCVIKNCSRLALTALAVFVQINSVKVSLLGIFCASLNPHYNTRA